MDQVKKFLTRVPLASGCSAHPARDHHGMPSLHPGSRHAESTAFDNDSDTGRIQVGLKRFCELYGEALLNLQASAEETHETGERVQHDGKVAGRYPTWHRPQIGSAWPSQWAKTGISFTTTISLRAEGCNAPRTT